LKRLEYRGYDSAGISFFEDEKIVTLKAVGKVSELENKINGKDFKAVLGIAHTRWATHGKPCDKNSRNAYAFIVRRTTATFCLLCWCTKRTGC